MLETFATAAEARARCEADVYEFHWPDEQREIAKACLNLKTVEQLQLLKKERSEAALAKSKAKPRKTSRSGKK